MEMKYIKLILAFFMALLALSVFISFNENINLENFYPAIIIVVGLAEFLQAFIFLVFSPSYKTK